MSDQLLGIIGQTGLLLLAGGAMLVRNDSALKGFQREINKMQQQLESLAQVVTKQAVQDVRLSEQDRRMNSIVERMEQLRKGEGYIQDRPAKTVDREYP
ncbi:MAG: hypothetical protein KGL35_24940 [Bradyrhizobium sp.]|nr:hypothetical protein [Bradyrhizobium sp.]